MNFYKEFEIKKTRIHYSGFFEKISKDYFSLKLVPSVGVDYDKDDYVFYICFSLVFLNMYFGVGFEYEFEEE